MGIVSVETFIRGIEAIDGGHTYVFAKLKA